VNKGAIKNAGINEGFVIISANDTPMRSVNDLQDAVKAASTSRDPVLYIKGVYPTGRKGYFAIQLESE
jgi:S1-C subfamily serine protease